MKSIKIVSLLIIICAAGCVTTPAAPATLPRTSPPADLPATEPRPTTPPSPTHTTQPSPSPTAVMPPVVGPEPYYRVAAFYYPWYRTPQVDGRWDHWGEGSFYPPLDIASDFYPTLGVYSIADPAVLGQHFAWLREAGVGVIVSSWWGRQSAEEQAVALLLEVADRYGIKVAFHIENYHNRTAKRLVDDIEYLYRYYGDHPAFFRSTAPSRWSPDERPKGLFFLWSSRFPNSDFGAAEADYWRDALDAIHALPDGGLVLADETLASWVDGGHFDGLYNYALLEAYQADGYDWARALPPDSWYVPGVIPGFSAKRIRYSDDTFTPRRDGETYNRRWQAALGVGVEPAMAAITSFNEWHEGTQIEPAAVGAENGRGYTYEDYGPLDPGGYLNLTRQWVDRFVAMNWPASYPIRLHLTTSSDWTTLALLDGATWLRPSLVSASDEADIANMDGGIFTLTQPIGRAETGAKVEMVYDILLADIDEGGMIEFAIERGHLGKTLVEFFSTQGEEPVLVKAFVWQGINSHPRLLYKIQIDSALLAAP